MKKIFALFLALTMVLSLTGCGGDSVGLPSESSTPSTSDTTEISNNSTGSTQGSTQESTPDTTENTTDGDTSIDETKSEPDTPSTNTGSTFSVHFIDVGQADSALVECDGHYMLIDGGNKGDSNVVYSVLQKAGVKKLDIVVGTHAHEDHIGGLPGAFNYTTADLTLCPVKTYLSNAFSDFAKYANQKGVGITVPKVGDTYALGSAAVKILGVNGDSDVNNTSIVLRIDYGQTSFLFTGDAEREAEQVILNSGADLNATVLKVGHHGSDTSTTYPFLRKIMPQYAVISVGTSNSYGHPTENTLSRLRDADVKVFRTDLQGDIYCTSDGTTVSFSVKKNANADVFGGIGNNSTSQQKPTQPAAPETQPSPTPSEQLVWIPKTGTKYHSKSTCSNMKNPTQVTQSVAVNRGYTACSKCW